MRGFRIFPGPRQLCVKEITKMCVLNKLQEDGVFPVPSLLIHLAKSYCVKSKHYPMDLSLPYIFKMIIRTLKIIDTVSVFSFKKNRDFLN